MLPFSMVIFLKLLQRENVLRYFYIIVSVVSVEHFVLSVRYLKIFRKINEAVYTGCPPKRRKISMNCLWDTLYIIEVSFRTCNLNPSVIRTH